MSRPSAPSMPTERQVVEAHKTVTTLYPAARIKSVGPEGVTFEYPDGSAGDTQWTGKPFTGEAA